MLKLKNREFIYACLQILMNKNHKSDFDILVNSNECKRRFDMNYAILQKVCDFGSIDKSYFLDATGNRRYYPNTITFQGVRYIVCNDWYYEGKSNNRDTRTDFLNWVLKD